VKDQEKTYRDALEQAIREYEQLAQERARIDERLAQVVQTIGNLSRLCRLAPTVQLGLTDACRMVLKSAGHSLTAREVKAQLEAVGFEVSRYANPLASIHTVLRRLCRSGEVRFVRRVLDKPAFAWKPPARIVAIKSDAIGKLNLWQKLPGMDSSEGET
jgi:hypothetical protein